MSRRRAAPKRAILQDPLFKSTVLSKFINNLMQHGKKSVAEKIVYDALQMVLKKVMDNPGLVATRASDQGDDEGGNGQKDLTPVIAKLSRTADIRQDASAREVALAAFNAALKRVTPMVEVKSRRVGGSTYQVPVPVHAKRRDALAMRWIVTYAGQRGEKTMSLRLSAELVDALEDRGGAFKKLQDMIKMAKANQAFAHFRW